MQSPAPRFEQLYVPVQRIKRIESGFAENFCHWPPGWGWLPSPYMSCPPRLVLLGWPSCHWGCCLCQPCYRTQGLALLALQEMLLLLRGTSASLKAILLWAACGLDEFQRSPPAYVTLLLCETWLCTSFPCLRHSRSSKLYWLLYESLCGPFVVGISVIRDMESEAAVYRDKCNNGEIRSNLDHQKMQTKRGGSCLRLQSRFQGICLKRTLQKSQSPTLPELQGRKSANYAELVSPPWKLLVLVVFCFHITHLLLLHRSKWSLPCMIIHLVMWSWLCSPLCSGWFCACTQGTNLKKRLKLWVVLCSCWQWESVKQRESAPLNSC